MMLTAEIVSSLIDYSPETGEFKRIKKTSNSVKIGGKAGSISNYGYLRISIGGKLYMAHRLAWLLMTGNWPEDQIDHINGIRDDNRWINLRKATNQENGKNQCIRSTNKSGITGVTWIEATQKWRAQITVDGKAIHLGVFPKIEDAATARKVAERKFEFHNNHGRAK
jgi:hypothetical protein